MTPTTGNALIVLVAFVLPGFVTLFISERTHTVPRTISSFERLMRALYYSVLSWSVVVLIAWMAGENRNDITHLYRHERNVGLILGAAFAAIVVLPILISYGGFRWSNSKLRSWTLERLKIDEGHTTPTAWDYFFLKRRVGLVRVTLKDGRVVGGYYGGKSFASYGEQERDLFLEKRWVLDDDRWFKEPAKGNTGLWLSRDSIVSFEVYDEDEDES